MKKNLKNDKILTIFPEGTRNKTGNNKLQPIKGGTVVFAVKSRAPIVPMMIDGKFRIFKKAHLIIGKPFELSDYYQSKLDQDNVEQMEKIVVEKMVEQQNILSNLISDKNKRKKVKKVSD